jgi:hypothetical protein
MAQAEMMPPANVVERNLSLIKEIMQYLLDHPQLFSALPDQFELVVLPEDDPEMRRYNLELLDKYGSEGKPIVFARVKLAGKHVAIQDGPSLYAPIPLGQQPGQDF